MTTRTFANIVLGGAVTAGVLATAYCLLHGGTTNAARCLLPAFVAVAAGLALRLNPERRLAAAITGVLCTLVLWVVDAFLATRPLDQQRQRTLERAARVAGTVRDPRSAVEVVRGLRRNGIDAYASVYTGNVWDDWPWLRDTLYPLGGISDVVSLMCQERGPYVMYRADERGFTNPPGQWGRSDIDLALVGDSFTQGWCVRPTESFAALVRAQHPPTIVLGMGASGPLMHLAMIREYLPALHPRRVLWVFCELNDLYDLARERTHPLLPRYLDSAFSQRLAARQPEIDAGLRAFSAVEESTAVLRDARRRARQSVLARAIDVVKLFHLRDRLAEMRRVKVPRPCCDVGLFTRAASAMKAAVASWGGTLEVVYLPNESTVAGRPSTDRAVMAGDSVRAVLDSLRIPVLDLRDAFRAQGPSREVYAPLTSHLTPKGNRVFADAVLRYLASDSARAR